MKAECEIHRFDPKQGGKPPNWFWAQTEAHKKGLAPDPWHQPLLPLLKHELCDRDRNGADLAHVAKEEWSDAGRWFQEDVEVYVINLPKNVQRMKRIAARLDELDIPF